MDKSSRKNHQEEVAQPFYNARVLLNGRYASYLRLTAHARGERLPLEWPRNRWLKRAADLVIATLAIVLLLSWLIPLLALIITIDSRGPVFFLQRRNKRDGKTFTCIKFRTMIRNENADVLPATVGDQRITAVGRFLRKYYLDELPQFLNVLWGDMSVIGPRPHMINENKKYEILLEQYDWRHRVKPGITGLAQIMGYVGATTDMQDMKRRVLMDISYVRHWSFRLDVIIIYRTFFGAKLHK